MSDRSYTKQITQQQVKRAFCEPTPCVVKSSADAEGHPAEEVSEIRLTDTQDQTPSVFFSHMVPIQATNLLFRP